MSSRTLGRAAVISLALGTGTIACTPNGGDGHVASASGAASGAVRDAGRLADAARAALGRHQALKAVRLAERASAIDPREARHRLLLGQAYLAVGRFASADTSFRDALSLRPEDPRAGLQLALAEIGEGRIADARARLATLDGKVSDADLGLALALAGDRAQAIDRLTAMVRAGKSDARARQNLALAFALDGRWREARGVAMQDVGPDRINDQIASWAVLAAASDPRVQVASVLGTKPFAGDPGRPAQLALAQPAPVQPTAVAAAQPAPIVDITAPAPRMAMIALPAPVFLAPAPAPAQVAESAVMPQLAAIAAQPAAVPALLAAPRAVTPRSLVRVAARRPVAPGPILAARQDGGWVVQLGAFARSGALEAAWTKVERITPHVATFTAVSGRTRASGSALVRLSLSGFADRASATRLCVQIKQKGGSCFVRASGNDSPWRWARRDAGTQVAMADGRRVS